MNGDTFTEAVNRYLDPVMRPLGFESEIRVSGRLYSANFQSSSHMVSVSFEPGDEYWLVVVHTVTDGLRSEIDDRVTTPRLGDLNAKYLTSRDGPALEALQSNETTINPMTQKIRKIAAELAVVLPRYLNEALTKD
jgi:hypothetical protein